jgi:hypothetical protein
MTIRGNEVSHRPVRYDISETPDGREKPEQLRQEIKRTQERAYGALSRLRGRRTDGS